MGDAHFAADAVSRVDRKNGSDGLLGLRIVLGELADRARRFARMVVIEAGVVTIEMRLAADFNGTRPTQAKDRLIAAVAQLKLLELFEVLDRRAHHRRVAPRQRADAD